MAPCAFKTASAGRGGAEAVDSTPGVSVWRTYLIANEWNEIQTLRKTSPTLQIIVVIFLLKAGLFFLQEPSEQLNRPNFFKTVEEVLGSFSFLFCYGIVKKKDCLKVCGMEHLATSDPLNSLTLDDGQYHSESSYICR